LLRTILHHTRKCAHKLLGTNHVYNQGSLDDPTSSHQKIMDRITRLEAQVNWRNLGDPSSLGNLKLEQLAATNDKDLLRDLCDNLSGQLGDPNEQQHFNSRTTSEYFNRIIVTSPSTVLNKLEVSYTYLLDPQDVFTNIQAQRLDDTSLLRVAPLTYLQALGDKDLTFIWLSDFLHRAEPITAMLTLLHCVKNLKPGSKVAGYIKADSNDPRVFKEFDLQMLTKFKSGLDIKTEGNVFEFTIV